MRLAGAGRRHRRIRRVVRLLGAIGGRFNRLQWVALAIMTAAIAVGVASALAMLSPAPAVPHGEASRPALLPPPAHGEQATAPGETSAVIPAVRLVVPAGRIDLRVIEGDGVTVPLHLAMHYPGTAQPGPGDNAVFYAHAQPGMFLGLYSLHLADEIDMTLADGAIMRYRVASISRVPWNDGDVLRHTAYAQITLLTCTSYDPYTPRLVVTATPA